MAAQFKIHDGLFATPVTAVMPRGIMFLVSQMIGQLRLQRSLQHRFGEFLSRPFSPIISSGFLQSASNWLMRVLSIAIGFLFSYPYGRLHSSFTPSMVAL